MKNAEEIGQTRANLGGGFVSLDVGTLDIRLAVRLLCNDALRRKLKEPARFDAVALCAASLPAATARTGILR